MQVMFQSVIPEGEAGEQFMEQLFRIYDKDGSGEIDVEEMTEIFSLMYTVQGFTEEEGKERAEKIFETLDKNGDGSLEEEEFIKGCLLDKQLLEMLNGATT